MRNLTRCLCVCALLCLGATGLDAHCEIPCGIYDDATRITLLREHIDTIEKSMTMIAGLSGETPVNYNQLVRWVANKDAHAEELQHVVMQYFMNQRVKPAAPGSDGYDAYVEQITVLHRLLVTAMKAKQTIDRAHVATMRQLVDRFEQLYFHHE